MIPPLIVSVLVGDGAHMPFFVSGLLILATGLLLWFPRRRSTEELRTRDGFLIVTLFWLMISAAGSLPLMFGTDPYISFTDAMFESMSGLTTTGASILDDIDGLPLSIRYYRQQLNWLGGMGIVVLAVAILPTLGVGGMQLYRAEMPGPTKEARLTPRIGETAKALWYIYVGLTLACAIAYWVAGLSVFDAIAHSFSTISTGGFSPYGDSLGHFDNPAAEMVGALFMYLAAVNFSLHFFAWRRRSATHYFSDPEFRFYAFLLAGAIMVVVVGLVLTSTLPTLQAIRYAIFQVVTFSTNTGLATTDYYNWPGGFLVMLLYLSIIGGCAGSTAGGIKTLRAVLLIKQGGREVLRLIHPQGVIPLRFGSQVVSNNVSTAIWGFFAVYMAVFALSMLALMAVGLDQVTAFSAVIATINNLGIGIAGVAPGFGHLTDTAKWVLIALMLMGRVEIFTVLILFMPAFWRH
ncbi:TrkH family potassium uptake protein [Alkalilimnicola ehrlichii]|uniref:Trk system potassium uptake protein n=1 Tax=Alkalilimnicola ehrlichii TaxID=351052 RepID=A0A3E0WYR1_9GAMM|nr:potassium transporter [Alkalilimnicola ehrlichii]